MWVNQKDKMVTQEQALPGRDGYGFELAKNHYVNGQSLLLPYPDGLFRLVVGLGCFWGAERLFWNLQGVEVTAVGYIGGFTPFPTYEEVCSGLTGHTEAVMVMYRPEVITLTELLKTFWEAHDPTQGMRQGNDLGTQYRSAIYCQPQDLETVLASADRFQRQLTHSGLGKITTEIKTEPTWYFAEEYHQQYLAKNPNGYCGLKGTGVQCI